MVKYVVIENPSMDDKEGATYKVDPVLARPFTTISIKAMASAAKEQFNNNFHIPSTLTDGNTIRIEAPSGTILFRVVADNAVGGRRTKRSKRSKRSKRTRRAKRRA